ncbi:Ig-like domain-containing protein [Halosquirtibacter xylanolyticus]|uniref:Ig-like domain-containing protein n=1 Tax=Halosquirtibacter xylanolyticus TaxID=3374599 RepID=UPI003748F97C|nr:Ig-like domain-containing protein [Prolixibacteraceae bacterium]
MKIRDFLTFTFFLLLIISCKDSDDDIRFDVTTKKIEFYSREKAKIFADGPTSIEYKVKNHEVAVVNKFGEVTAVKVGKTEIEVTDGVNTFLVPVEVKAKYAIWDFPIGIKKGISTKELEELRGAPINKRVIKEEPFMVLYEYHSDDPRVEKLYFIFKEDKLSSMSLSYVEHLCPNIKDAFWERYFRLNKSIKDSYVFRDRSKQELSTCVFIFSKSTNSISYRPL